MDVDTWATIRRLFEVEKLSKSAIARRLSLHRKTVRRALASVGGPPANLPRRLPGVSKLNPYKSYLRERLKSYPELPGAKLLVELRSRGYAGGHTILKDYLQTIRVKAPKAFLRIETQPGEFGQVDWANIGTIQIGNAKRKLSCFVMILSYSRMMYIELTLSQCLEDFLAAHVHAFRFFGGIPKKINYDNLKTVVLARVGREIRFNPKFLNFAGYCLFEPIPCGVRQAHEKGKVESGIKYVRSSFLSGRPLSSLPELRRDAEQWLTGEANVRIHGTTRERPVDRFETERPLLQLPPQTDYDCAIVRTVEASSQALVRFQSNRYSVPYRSANKTLTLKALGQTICIYDGTQLLTTHPRSFEKYQVLENPDHYAGLLAKRKKAHQAKRLEAFLALAAESEAYLKGLVGAELHLAGHLERILGFVRLYGKEDVVIALRRALKYTAFGAPYIQNIVLQRRAQRHLPPPRPVILTKKPEWANVTVEETDLSIYDELFATEDEG